MQFLGLQPITGVAGCCERAASGQAAAPPTMVMNSRRLTGSSSGREPRPYHIIEQTAKVLRVGLVGVQPRDAAIYVAFRKRMVELGYREDRYFTFEYIQTPSIDAYDASFRELAARKPDIVIAAGNEPALRAASAAAGTLPIVFLAIDFDPVERGYVASLARPGGNITGIFLHPLELAAKRIELVREALPQGRHPGLIWDS